MSRFKQVGKNTKYPEVILSWKDGESLPEWLSDVCRISIDKYGDAILVTKPYGKEGFSILKSGMTEGVLVSLNSKNDYVCKGERDYNIFVLSPTQMNILYNEIK